MRNLLSLIVFLAVTLTSVVYSCGAAESKLAGSTSLADAVSTFNARAGENPIGKEQPLLTEEEVIAAIRWWEFHRKESPVSDEEFRAFRNAAETRRLPAGWELEVLTGFEPNHQVTFEAWSVRLRMPRENGMTYAFSIRERMVRSRLSGPEERKVIEKWDRSALGSFERVQYQREREAAAARDRSKQE